jgi:hypothetical protein
MRAGLLGVGALILACGNVISKTEIGTRFAVMGHLDPFAADPSKLEAFLDAVVEEKPDLVFVLGDSALDDPEVVKAFRKTFRHRVYFSPGDHELEPETRRPYLENVGYLEHTVTRPDCNFVLVNSSDPVERIVAFTTVVLDEFDPENPTILMTHHRVWDDTSLSATPYQQDKSYYFSSLYPALQGRVRYIFAGNSRRQYFRDVEKSPSFGNQNLNAVYWVDQVGDITAHSVGMGDAFPRATFVVAEVVGDGLLVTPHGIAWDGRDLADPTLVQPIATSQPPLEDGSR